MRKLLSIWLFLFSSYASAQSPQTSATPDRASEGPKFDDYKTPRKRPKEFEAPAENRTSDARVLLGKTLFFDPRLSGNNSMSCSTCHNPALAWSDGLPQAIGAGGKKLDRRTPSLLNVGSMTNLQWDAAFHTLEEQAAQPIQKKAEMNQDLSRLPIKIKAIKGYRPLFEAAYPDEPISLITITKALAAFQRTIQSGPTPYEAFLAGDDSAMSLDAKMGLVLFNGPARCSICHSSTYLTDQSIYDIGHKSTDRGRGAVSKEEWNDFKFRNPGLLDVARRAPYMHDGSLPDLMAVIDFYDRGGDVKRVSTSGDIFKLNLTPLQKAQLLAFLNTLTSPVQPFEMPTLPE